MKIKLSSQRKQCFEAEVESTASILDLKKLIIDHFGFPEDSISMISIVVKHVIVRDMTKTLFDLGISEGSLIYFYAPSKLVPTKSSSTTQTSPKTENQQQNGQNQPKEELTSSQNSTSPSHTENQNSNPTKTENKQSQSQPTETETTQKVTQPIETAQVPIPSEIFERPKPENQQQNVQNQPKEELVSSQNSASPSNTENQNSNPSQTEEKQSVSQPTETETTQKVIHPAETVQETIPSEIFERPKPPQTATFQYSNATMNDFQFSLNQKSSSKVEQLKEMGVDERHARVFLKSSLNNINIAIEMMTSPFYQKEENFERLEKFVNHQLSPQETIKFKTDVMESHGYSKDQTNMFKMLAEFQQQRQQQRQQLQQQLQERLQQFRNQIQNVQTRDVLKQNLNVLEVGASAMMKLKNIESTPIEEYINPFAELMQLFDQYNKTDFEEYKIYEAASKLNRDQVIFVSQMIKCGFSFDETISTLEATDGDIESARAILFNK